MFRLTLLSMKSVAAAEVVPITWKPLNGEDSERRMRTAMIEPGLLILQLKRTFVSESCYPSKLIVCWFCCAPTRASHGSGCSNKPQHTMATSARHNSGPSQRAYRL